MAFARTVGTQTSGAGEAAQRMMAQRWRGEAPERRIHLSTVIPRVDL